MVNFRILTQQRHCSRRQFASDCPFRTSFGRFQLILYQSLRENTLKDLVCSKKVEKQQFTDDEIFRYGDYAGSHSQLDVFLKSTCRKQNDKHNCRKIARNEKRKMAHWRRFLGFSALAPPDFTRDFWLIHNFFCSDLAIETFKIKF